MSDITLVFNDGAILENDVLQFERGVRSVVEPIDLDVSVEEYDLDVDGNNELDAALETAISVTIISGEHYSGPLTVTPTQQTQTLETQNLVMDGNVTVNPIPSNYGLITWNGSVLTVS